MNSVKVTIVLLLFSLGVYAQIQPTLINNPNVNYNYSYTSTVSLSGSQFAIFFGGPDNTLIIRSFPSNTTITYQFSNYACFIEAIKLLNGQIVTYFNFPGKNNIEGLILNQDLSVASILNISINPNVYPVSWSTAGMHAVPTTQGFALANAVGNGGPVVVQYVYFNGTLGNQVALPQGPALAATGVGFPNGSVLIIWDNSNLPWSLWYILTDFEGNFLTSATPYNQQYYPQFSPAFAWLPNGQLISTWNTYALNIRFDVWESGTFNNLFVSELEGVTDGEHEYQVFLPFNNGNMLLIWLGEPQNYLNSPMVGIYGRIYNTSGPVTDTFVVTNMNLTQFSGTNPWEAAILEDQTFVVSWSGQINDSQNNQIYALRFNSQGEVVNFNPNPLSRYTLCDTYTYKCQNTNYKLVFVGSEEIIE